jgi:uncharacterized protein DUF6476
MSDPYPQEPDPGNLRFLRIMVTTLIVVMIVGFLVIVGLFIRRLTTPVPSAALTLPASIALPEGASALSFSVGPGWIGVVTQDSRILIFDAASGRLRQTLQVDLSE